jgi:GNAT superfamily N-acetyltransferase
MLKFHRLQGQEGREYLLPLAELRLKVFSEFPYLYEGSLEYEKNYLETYFKAQHSFIFLIEENKKIIGATTGILADEEEESFKKPFVDYGLDPEKVFYFGESILMPEFRGKGLGKVFFEEREKFARTLPLVEVISFCAVERSSNHPLRPISYRPLDDFWAMMGFKKESGLITEYDWKDIDQVKSSKKRMQYWIKRLNK